MQEATSPNDESQIDTLKQEVKTLTQSLKQVLEKKIRLIKFNLYLKNNKKELQSNIQSLDKIFSNLEALKNSKKSPIPKKPFGNGLDEALAECEKIMNSREDTDLAVKKMLKEKIQEKEEKLAELQNANNCKKQKFKENLKEKIEKKCLLEKNAMEAKIKISDINEKINKIDEMTKLKEVSINELNSTIEKNLKDIQEKYREQHRIYMDSFKDIED